MSRFPFSFFFYLLLKCKTFFKPLFKLNYTGVNLLYQSPEAGGGGGDLWIKRASFKFLDSKIDFFKKNKSWMVLENKLLVFNINTGEL